MSAEYQKWEKLKTNYLKQVQQSLASVNHPKTSTILHDVESHLDSKYADLEPDRKNWEGCQQILIEMGPPDEYAEFLGEGKVASAKQKTGLNVLLALVLFAMLAAATVYLVNYSEKPQTTEQAVTFVPDERVFGLWTTIDFVKSVEDFDPSEKSWPGELFLSELIFEDKGDLWWTNQNGGPYRHGWTKGKVDPTHARSAQYEVRRIGDQNYLFFEWISGDATERNEPPYYYVLTQETTIAAPEPVVIPEPAIEEKLEADEPAPPLQAAQTPTIEPLTIAEPSVIGQWVAVDYVKIVESFDPDQLQYKKNLLLKAMNFTSSGAVYWHFGNGTVKQTTFDDTIAQSVTGHPANFSLKTVKGQDYLFIEWITLSVTKKGQMPCYYVLKRSAAGDNQIQLLTHEMDAHDIVGQWVSVDFVQSIDDFKPGYKQWKGSLYLKDLSFFENGKTSGPWTWQKNYLWHPNDKTKSYFSVYKMQGAHYLFMEWMSGDVTIRGQQPAYYVLKKVPQQLSTGYASRTGASRRITFGSKYNTTRYIRTLFGQPEQIDHGGRMLRYTSDGMDFWFSTNGLLGEIHLNKGYKGQLDTGISMASTKQEVFAAYGQPVRTLQAADLHRKNDDRILYQKEHASRIYYKQDGLIFWFSGDRINQIVPFKGTVQLTP